MNPFIELANDCAALQAEQGGDCPTMVWNNLTWNILPGSVMQNAALRAGGFSTAFDFSFVIVVQQFVAANLSGVFDAPSLVQALLNKEIDYLGQGYKVANVHILSGATLLRVEANALNQNA